MALAFPICWVINPHENPIWKGIYGSPFAVQENEAQGTFCPRWSWDLNPGSLAPEPVHSTTMLSKHALCACRLLNHTKAVRPSEPSCRRRPRIGKVKWLVSSHTASSSRASVGFQVQLNTESEFLDLGLQLLI